MRKLRLSQGKYALVDDEDYDWLSQWKWTWMRHSGGRGNGYAYRKVKEKTQLMHRLIMGNPLRPLVVDHINGNGLDNRRKNLRVVGNGLNTINTPKLRKGASSKYLGVHWCNTANRWIARARKNGKVHCAGYFKDEKLAAQAAKELRLKLWGDNYRGW